MKANRMLIDKLLLQWEIRKIASGVLHGDEAVGEMLSGQSNRDNGLESLRDLVKKGWDIVIEDENEALQSSELFFTTSTHDIFGNSRNLSKKEQIKQKMEELEELGRKLISEERYEQAQEAHEIWLKLKKEYDDYV